MCFFPYKTKQSKKKPGKRSGKEDVTEAASKAASKAVKEAMGQMFPSQPTFPARAQMPHLSQNHLGCRIEPWLEEIPLGYITRSQWITHDDTLKSTLDATEENGKKIDDTRATVVGDVKATYDVVKDAHAAVIDAHTTIKDAHAEIKSTHDTLKENHAEHLRKQNECAAEMDKVRKLLEDEAKLREESARREQDRQDAFAYMEQFLRWEANANASTDANANANANTSSRSSSRTASSHGNGSPRRRRAASEESRESEKRRQREREAAADIAERLARKYQEGQAFGEGLRREREHDTRSGFYAYGPTTTPPWPGQEVPPSSSQGERRYTFPHANYHPPDFGMGDRGRSDYHQHHHPLPLPLPLLDRASGTACREEPMVTSIVEDRIDCCKTSCP